MGPKQLKAGIPSSNATYSLPSASSAPTQLEDRVALKAHPKVEKSQHGISQKPCIKAWRTIKESSNRTRNINLHLFFHTREKDGSILKFSDLLPQHSITCIDFNVEKNSLDLESMGSKSVERVVARERAEFTLQRTKSYMFYEGRLRKQKQLKQKVLLLNLDVIWRYNLETWQRARKF